MSVKTQKLADSPNIVILAEKHNPAIPTKDWLLNKGILSEEPINFVNLPVLSIFESKTHLLTIDENKLQLSLKIVNEVNLSELPNIIKKYVTSLPETPFKAIGLNYKWIIKSEAKDDLLSFIKGLVRSGDNKIDGIFPEHRLGVIIYTKQEDFILRLLIDSVKKKPEIFFDFNYHYDTQSLEEITSSVDRFFALFNNSNEIVDNLTKELKQ